MPQGTLAERMRAAGAGIGAFFCPTGAGTLLAEGKETRTIDGREHVLEFPIKADVALIRAHRADAAGNLVYRKTGRNFGPVMATAAALPSSRWPRSCRRRARPRGRGHARASSSIASSSSAAGDRVVSEHRTASAATRSRGSSPPTSRRGAFVNLGIGQPTRVADFLRPEQRVTLHTENGMLGMGPEAHGDDIDPDLINAGKVPVTELPGASYFHHADSFAMMRGGHLDVCVLGAFQVAANGDLANWHTGGRRRDPGRRRRDGSRDRRQGRLRDDEPVHPRRRPEARRECTYPLTGLACVSRVYTEHAVFALADGVVTVEQTFGITFAELADRLCLDLVEGWELAGGVSSPSPRAARPGRGSGRAPAACVTPGGVTVSITLGARGSTEQIGAVPPGGADPELVPCAGGWKPRAWSGAEAVLPGAARR